jgi:subtilisin family serine protease
LNALHSQAGIGPVERVRATETEGVSELLECPGVSVYYEELAVVVVEVRPEQRHALVVTAERESSIIAAEPERMVHAAAPIIAPHRAPAEFFPAYRSDEEVFARHTEAEIGPGPGPAWEEQALTWGLQAIRANLSGVTGRGVKVAVLDTGVDTEHPDLAGHIEATACFVAGATVADGNGHGTHCAGTAAGPAKPSRGPRYGVACDAGILAAKVLSDAGAGTDGQILAGIAWAVAHGAQVISMSLGGPVRPGELFPQTYEQVARYALRHQAVTVAAAGDDSDRPTYVQPVSRPANCPSVLGVAALDKTLTTTYFSNGGINIPGGEVDVAAPGRDVHSAAPDGWYQTLSGTSTATAHVAGVIALLAQAHPDASAAELKSLLLARAFPLAQPARDVGSGMVLAP